MAPRVLILTASVGEGHDAPARTLTDQLRSESPDVEVSVEDGLAVMGRAVRAMSESAPRVVFFQGEWLWDLGYTVFARIPVTRRLSQLALAQLGSNGLLRLVAAADPDVVVSLYPQTTEVLGRLRRNGRLDVPLVAGVTDLAGLWYWATPGADVHLVTHPESVPEVRAIAGRHAEVHCVHGFTSPAFLEPPDRESARAALSLPGQGTVVLVSGGGWGVGRIGEALEVCLGIGKIDLVACLCGRNERLVDELARRYGGEPRIRIEGFTSDMPDWLAAVDVLVHSTGGLTVLEAQMSGCPAVSFGWGRGHVRAHNEAFKRFGLAQVADSATELEVAVERALRNPGVIPFDASMLPSAASIVLAHAHARQGRAQTSA